LAEGVTLAEACIGTASIDTYNRSRVQQETDSLATVTGAAFADPFDPGNNQSLVLHNPYQSTQMAVNVFSIFPDDPEDENYYLRNGVIEFDVFLETPLPNSLYSFLDIRFGFQANPEDRDQVATTGDATIWNVFNVFGDVINDPAKRQIAEDVLIQRASRNFEDNLYDQGNNEFFIDELVAAARAMHVRYEIDGDNSTYKVFIDNLDDPDGPVEVGWPSGAEQPWIEFFNFQTFQFEPAPGINEISFLTDASGFAVTNVSQNVYIDNLRIVDNDLPPLPEERAGDLNGDEMINFGDLTPFVLALSNISSYETMFPGLDRVARCDVNDDGSCNFGDLTPFVTLLSGGIGTSAGQPVPEPPAFVLISVVVLAAARFARPVPLTRSYELLDSKLNRKTWR
jgi:hypothetical protein